MPFEQRVRSIPPALRLRCMPVLAGAGVGLLLLCGLHWATAAPFVDEPATASNSALIDDKAQGDVFTYNGAVVEKATKKPISGAVLTVTRFVWPDPTTGGRRILQETRQQSDAAGKFHFTSTAAQMAEERLAVCIRVEHPAYPMEEERYYNFRKFRGGIGAGDDNAFVIELSPGEPIAGVVRAPDGKPVAGAVIRSFSYLDGGETTGQLVMGADGETQTDKDGRFRLIVLAHGKVDLKLLPADFALLVHELNERQRGELGPFVLQKGTSLTGKVVDSDGSPVSGTFINVAGFPKQPKSDPVWDESHWDGIGSFSRTTLTNAAGEFTFGPLPPGFYRVMPVDQDRSAAGLGQMRPLRAPFVPVRVKLSEGEVPKPLVIRALPHVAIEARIHDSHGRPCQGIPLFLSGTISNNKPARGAPKYLSLADLGTSLGRPWTGSSWSDLNGRIVFRAPFGLELAMVTFADFADEAAHAVRYRIGKDRPLRDDQSMSFESIDREIHDVEIIRYDPPTVFVRALAKDGAKMQNVRVELAYSDRAPNDIVQAAFREEMSLFLRFKPLDDGRFRSQRLLPDKTLTVTVSADGYKSRSETLKLREGENKELTVVLDR
jgi:hypothetical protein